NDFAAGTSFNSIAINDVGYTLAGNGITLAAPSAGRFATTAAGNSAFGLAATLSNAGATITLTGTTAFSTLNINGALTITGGSLTFDVDGSSIANANGAIGESGSSAALVKAGTGTLALNGPNTYSGMTTVNAGYLNVGHNNALGTGTNSAADGTVVNSGGSLAVGNVTIAGERIVLNGVGQSNNGAFQTNG